MSELVPNIRVLLIHTNRIARLCIARWLTSAGNFSVTVIGPEQVTDWAESHELEQFDVVLLDLNMDSLKATNTVSYLKHVKKASGCVILASGQHRGDLAACFVAGAQGCLVADSDPSDLEAAIVAVAAGGTYCSPSMVYDLCGWMSAGNMPELPMNDILTPREMEILAMISGHAGNKEIAKRLNISIYTVKNHVHNIVDKLHVDTRHEAVDFARGKGWLSQPKESELCLSVSSPSPTELLSNETALKKSPQVESSCPRPHRTGISPAWVQSSPAVLDI